MSSVIVIIGIVFVAICTALATGPHQAKPSAIIFRLAALLFQGRADTLDRMEARWNNYSGRLVISVGVLRWEPASSALG